MSGAVTAAVVVGAAVVGSTIYSTEVAKSQAKKTAAANRVAQQQTLAYEKQATADAQAKDKARRMNIDMSESATTTYGVARDTKLDLTANSLLVPRDTLKGSLGGSTSRVGLGF